MLSFQCFESSSGGVLLGDWSGRATSLSFGTNKHGFSTLQATIPMSAQDAFQLYDRGGTPHLVVSDNLWSAWEGRLEDLTITEDGIQVTGLGYWRAFSDISTPLLRSTARGEWKPTTDAEIGNHSSVRFEYEIGNGVLKIMPRKGEYFGSNIPLYGGSVLWRSPRGTVGNPTYIMFSYEVSGGAGWTASLEMRGDDPNDYFGSAWSINTSASVQNGAAFVSISTADTLAFTIYFVGGPAQYTDETGNFYFKIWNIRILSIDPSELTTVSTTSTGAFGPGTVTFTTPTTTRKFYVGQNILLGNSTQSEIVTVQAVSGYTYTIATSKSWGGGTPINGYMYFGNRVVVSYLAQANVYNPSQIKYTTTLIQSTELDLIEALYLDDMTAADILTEVADMGDSTNRLWEVGVYEGQYLHFRPRGSEGKQWFVDTDHIEVRRSLDTLVNGGYALYKMTTGQENRINLGFNTQSVQKYGISRYKPIPVDTSNTTLATSIALTKFEELKDIRPQADIQIRKVYDSAGQPWPLYAVRSGDTVTVRNLPPTLSTTVDKIRTFRISETDYDAVSKQLRITPELAIPSLTTLITALQK